MKVRMDKFCVLKDLFFCLQTLFFSMQLIGLTFQFLDSLLILRNFAQKFSVNFFFVQVLANEDLGVINSLKLNKKYCCSFNFLKSKLNDSELFHFTFDLIPEHFVEESMGQKYFLPLFFIQVFVQHCSFGDFLNLDTSNFIGFEDLRFAHQKSLNVIDVIFSLFMLGLKLYEEFLINFRSSVFTLTEFCALLEENFQLFFQVG